MVNPVAKRSRRPLPKMLASAGIVLICFAVTFLFRLVPPLASATDATNNLFYDIYYRLRPFEDRKTGPIVIVAADQKSLDSIDKNFHFGWPWPREIWGDLATYVSKSGAKAIGFDIIFSETSVYEKTQGDDKAFARAISAIKMPVIFAANVNPDGNFQHFAPPIKNPMLAAVNQDDQANRSYPPTRGTKDAFATAVVKSIAAPKLPTASPFLLHYFGPNAKHTYQYVSADDVLEAQLNPKKAAQRGVIKPDLFKDKIVLFGAITIGTYDIKSSPLSKLFYPGVEVQATAVENLLFGQQVTSLPAGLLLIIPLICGIVAAFGVIYPRRAIWKLMFPAIALIAVFTAGVVLFHAPDIRWLPPAESLLVLTLATPTAFAYTYLAEDRQRRFMLKALSKIVSPAIADQLSKNPERLELGTVRTEITVLFTDLANFTTLSESLDDHALGELLNRYLGAMSDQVFENNGTLDKYIGDAVMCFWNAPLPQEDHAMLACRAALAMARREEELKQELGDLGKRLFTRIGVNTTSVRVGFVGSAHLFNYTAIGDGVNLCSRLEGANKIYGTRILLSESTALLVRSQFILRKLDLLQVKGKTKPIAVYELVAERSDASRKLDHIAAYEAALTAYQKQDWDTAERTLLELGTRFGEDQPSNVLLERIAAFRLDPPAADWDGTYEAKSK